MTNQSFGLRSVLALPLAMCLMQPTAAQGTSATSDSIAQTAISNLQTGHTKEAILGFFGGNPLMAGKQNELTMLISQIDGMIAIYGPIRSCELVATAKNGTLVENRQYLCQHDHFVTRWRLLMIRTASGWTGNNVSFDEKLTLPIDEN
jgi:hypothetical protein